jgi:hypothetical protein
MDPASQNVVDPDPQHCREDNHSLGDPKHRPTEGFRGNHVTYNFWHLFFQVQKQILPSDSKQNV